jgi:dihydroorotase
MIKIEGGRVIDPANGFDQIADITIDESGVIASSPAGGETVNANGMLVIPGVVDLCARLREPGKTHKATIRSEARAAAICGITTLCMPPDTLPVVDSQAVMDLIKLRVAAAQGANVVMLGALTQGLEGELLAQMAALKAAGCVGFSNANKPIPNALVLRRAMEYAASLGITVFLNSEDPQLSQNGCMHEGAVSTELGLPGIPTSAEVVGLARDLALVEQTGARAHFGRLSTARAVEMVREAKQRGLPVTADVAAHQLLLTESDVRGFNRQTHVRPPLRSEADRAALVAGVTDGTIDAICSDHQPHESDAKLAPFPATEAGISALDTLIPIVMQLVNDKHIPLSTAVAAITANPASILGLKSGTLSGGSRGDLAIVSQTSWELSADLCASEQQNTPFLGHAFSHRVVLGLVGGRKATG